MASGDTLIVLSPFDNSPPATIYATLDIMAGTSTPAESIPVLDFDDTAEEVADFYCFMPRNYSGGGITVKIMYSAAAATGVVSWMVALRRVADDAEDLDTTAQTYVYTTIVDNPVASAIGEVAYADVAITSGANMDSTVAGDYFILRVRRDTTPASGTDLVGDASIHMIEIRET